MFSGKCHSTLSLTTSHLVSLSWFLGSASWLILMSYQVTRELWYAHIFTLFWKVNMKYYYAIISYNLLVNKERLQYICFLIVILVIDLFSQQNRVQRKQLFYCTKAIPRTLIGTSYCKSFIKLVPYTLYLIKQLFFRF